MMRVGAIGAGMVSRHHQIAWAKLCPEIQVVAIADPVLDVAARRSSASSAPRPAAMLGAERLDAIGTAAPREHHASLVRMGVARGLAGLCQKPLAPTLAEAEALMAETSGRAPDGARELARPALLSRCRNMACRWRDRCGARVPNHAADLRPAARPGWQPPIAGTPAFFLHERRLLLNEVLIHHLDTLLRRHGGGGQRGDYSAGRIRRGRDPSGQSCVIGLPASQADEMLVLGDAGTIQLHGNRLE